jgi:hypothetical protein
VGLVALVALAAGLLGAGVVVVLFWGAEALSLSLLAVLAEGDEGLADLSAWDEGGEDPVSPVGQADPRLLEASKRFSLPARTGMGWLLWLVAWMEGRRPAVRGWLWAVGLGCAILVVRLGPAVDAVLGRGREERERRRLGRRLLYAMAVAHRGS